MTLHTFDQQQLLPITPREAWEFFSSPANLDAITPADLGFQITSPLAAAMFDGQIITYRIRIAPALWISWVTEIRCVLEGCASSPPPVASGPGRPGVRTT